LPVGQLAPHVLATREVLRPPLTHADANTLEPFSRGWFEEIEIKRYQREGAWLPRWLEFNRHQGESILILGPGLGIDAVRYERHGTRASVCVTPDDDADILHAHFRLRNAEIPILHAPSLMEMPFLKSHFDLVFWNGLHGRSNPGLVMAEIWRVLKPGGKLFGLFPARIDVDRWQRWCMPLRRYYRRIEPRPTTAPRRTARELKPALKQYVDLRIAKRQLRRSELPHLWRMLPLNVLERMMGRVLAVRAFKPIAAAIPHRRAAA
jgi:SAM-dependent methyltransferase